MRFSTARTVHNPGDFTDPDTDSGVDTSDEEEGEEGEEGEQKKGLISGLGGPSSQDPFFRVSVFAVRSLKHTGQSRVKLPLR